MQFGLCVFNIFATFSITDKVTLIGTDISTKSASLSFERLSSLSNLSCFSMTQTLSPFFSNKSPNNRPNCPLPPTITIFLDSVSVDITRWAF